MNEKGKALKDIEACLDEAVRYLVDLAGAKPDRHSPHNCRLKIDEARFYARHLASLKASQEAAPVAWRYRYAIHGNDWEAWSWVKVRPQWLDDPMYVVEPLYASPQPAPDTEGVRDTRCAHGIRWPWACHDCDRIALAKRKAAIAADGGSKP